MVLRVTRKRSSETSLRSYTIVGHIHSQALLLAMSVLGIYRFIWSSLSSLILDLWHSQSTNNIDLGALVIATCEILRFRFTAFVFN